MILGLMRALCTLQVPNAEIIKLILNLEYTYACAMCYVLCAMCYVLCAMCYVLCAMCYVLCAMCSLTLRSSPLYAYKFHIHKKPIAIYYRHV
ncbi:hypothetical protein P029_00925 [Anaplasma phagocytophilum str. Norway variant2]|uniref:Uncharacterized protein n=1 Tax=Anaplasma phagocytophilum str. Norway variant2 TaxID=1392507 RepID=A0A161I5F1_ANAPH|nr:hypothetical protein P029_00925 [Anaplasma phagocytophilum str. Norway variant2]